MKDVIHSPKPLGDGYVCIRCEVELPIEVCIAAAGADLVDIGGMGTMFVPSDNGSGSILCTHPGVEEVRRLSEALETATFEEAPLAPGETKTKVQPKSEFDKMVTRGAFGNFMAMREMTKPDNV